MSERIIHIILNDQKNKNILYFLFFFFIAGLCEIGGGYLVWLWLRGRHELGIGSRRRLCLIFIWYYSHITTL